MPTRSPSTMARARWIATLFMKMTLVLLLAGHIGVSLEASGPGGSQQPSIPPPPEPDPEPGPLPEPELAAAQSNALVTVWHEFDETNPGFRAAIDNALVPLMHPGHQSAEYAEYIASAMAAVNAAVGAYQTALLEYFRNHPLLVGVPDVVLVNTASVAS